jgi:hypothetical protein
MTDFAELGIRADTRDLRTAQDELRGLTRTGAETERAVSTSAEKISASWRRMAGIAGAALGTLAASFGLRAAINESEQYSLQLSRMSAIIRATGGVAGRTTAQLEAQAQALARASLESVDGVMSAQRVLLTFRNVQGEVFDRAIESAADLAAAMGGDIVSATRQIARALEDPINGVTALTRSGTVFTTAQRDMIRAMVEAGDTAGAQAVILAELEGQYGGAARAVPPLSSALDSLGQSMGNLRRAFVESTGVSQAFAFAADTASNIVQAFSENLGDLRGFIIATALGVTAYYLPAIAAATFQTGLWIASLITLRGALIATGIGGLIVGAGMLINLLLRLVENTGSLSEAFAVLGRVATGVWEGIVSTAQAIPAGLSGVWAGVQRGFIGLVFELSMIWRRFLVFLSGSLPDGGVLGGVFDGVRESLDGAIASGGEFRRGLSGIAMDLADVERAGRAAWSERTGFSGAAEAIAELRDILARTNEESGEVAQAIAAVNAELNNTQGAAGGASAAMRDMGNAGQDLASTMKSVESSFESAFVDFVTGAKSAQDAIASLMRDLARLAAQAAFRSLFGRLFSGGGGGGFLGSIFGGFRADGGPVSAGRAYVVGERGPEMFVPSGGGQIVPNEAMRGGGGVTVNIDARGAVEGVAVQIEAAIQRRLPEILQASSGYVGDRRLRGFGA